MGFKTLFVVILSFSGLLFIRFDSTTLDEKDSVVSILEQLDGEVPAHQPDFSIEGVSALQGKNIVMFGRAEKPKGGKTSKQSKHFVCTACHNIVKDDPSLMFNDPELRLDYAIENKLPFLQGSSLYGAVNRTSYYNGDYLKKYGKLVAPARNNIREAIQLCAVECAQGRLLEPWELESVLAFLWTIDLKIKDLNLSAKESELIDQALTGKDAGQKSSAVKIIKGKYAEGAPATFVYPPEDRKKGYAQSRPADKSRGKAIYEQACLHCHENNRYAFYNLDRSNFSLNHLANHFEKYDRYSVYQVSRYGTSPIPGKRTYMPQFTLEKMSNQQIEDLRAYLIR